jgi:transcriptional regulator with XRE-family HTH domain
VLLRQVIGNVFRRLRRERGITLRELAEVAQVSVPYLSEIERGRKEPSSEILAAICRALGLDLADLLDEVQLELSGARVAVPQRLPIQSIRMVESAPLRTSTSPQAYATSSPDVRPGGLTGAAAALRRRPNPLRQERRTAVRLAAWNSDPGSLWTIANCPGCMRWPSEDRSGCSRGPSGWVGMR